MVLLEAVKIAGERKQFLNFVVQVGFHKFDAISLLLTEYPSAFALGGDLVVVVEYGAPKALCLRLLIPVDLRRFLNDVSPVQ